MMRSILPFRAALTAIVLLVGTIDSVRAGTTVTVYFQGTQQTSATTTISGWFQYDMTKPVDRKLGLPVYGQFTFNASYAHSIAFTIANNGTPTLTQPATGGNSYIIYTNTDATYQKIFTLKVTNGSYLYAINLPTPNALSQTALPGCSEFPGGTGYPGTFTLTVGAGTPTIFNITVNLSGCAGPASATAAAPSEVLVYVEQPACIPQPACLPRRGCLSGIFHRRSIGVCGR